MDASLSRVASFSNVAPEALAKLRIAFRLMGGAAEEADEAVSGLSQAMFRAAINPGGGDFVKLGILQQRFGIRNEEMQDPISILTAIARSAATDPNYQGQVGRGRLQSLLQEFLPGVNQNLIFLIEEWQKRMAEAAPLVPAGGGQGEVSKEVVSAFAEFDVAAENLARHIVEDFVPAIKELTSWIKPGGWISNLLKGLEHPEEAKPAPISDKAWAPGGYWYNLFHPSVAGLTPALMPGAVKTIWDVWSAFRGPNNTVSPSLPTLPGFHGGIESLILPGAKGAAVVSNVHNTRSSTDHSSSSTSTTSVGNIHLNFPNVTSPMGVGNAVRGVISSASIGASANSGQQ